MVENIFAGRQARQAIVIHDPLPLSDVRSMWATSGQAAVVGIFLLLFGAFLYAGRAVLLPVLAAAVISMTLAPLIAAGRRHGVSPWVTSLLIIALSLSALALGATALAGPISEWIKRVPEIGATVQERLSVLQQPLAALRELGSFVFGKDSGISVNPTPNVVLPVVAFITPAAGELLIFFGTLMFFLVGQFELRANVVALFGERDTKLRFLKIMRDIERNLAGYLTVVTIVNVMIGTIVSLGTWLLGFPNPLVFGLLASILNYVPYVGPAITVMALFAVGLVSFPSLGQAFVAPISLIVLTATEGHFVTPLIIGRRLTLNPLLVFLALAFWTWLWGPIGAFLATPLLIIGLVVCNHLFPAEEITLPD